MRRLLLLAVCGLCVLLGNVRALTAKMPPWQLEAGDRVVLLGGTLFEQEQAWGYLETAMVSAVPNHDFIVRNLTGKGETVWGTSAARDNSSHLSYQQRLDLIQQIQPTVLCLGFGARESVADEAGISSFIQQYEQLLDDLAALNCRLVFLTPHQLESSVDSSDEVRQLNQRLERYVQAIRELAARRHGWLIDLFEHTAPVEKKLAVSDRQQPTGLEPPRGFIAVNGGWRSAPFTQDGSQLSQYGAFRLARVILQKLKLHPAEYLIQLDSQGHEDSVKHATIEDYQHEDLQVQFRAKLLRLTEPPTPEFPRDTQFFFVACNVLSSGNYQLKIDGVVAAINPTMLVGFPVRNGPDYDQAEELRQKIIHKNQCVAQLFSQELNSAIATTSKENLRSEIAQCEQEISTLKHPVFRVYEISPRETSDSK